MVMRDFVEMLGGQRMRDEYIRLWDPQITAADADNEMTEAEYQFALQKMQGELPAFKQYLAQCRLERLPGGGGLLSEP